MRRVPIIGIIRGEPLLTCELIFVADSELPKSCRYSIVSYSHFVVGVVIDARLLAKDRFWELYIS